MSHDTKPGGPVNYTAILAPLREVNERLRARVEAAEAELAEAKRRVETLCDRRPNCLSGMTEHDVTNLPIPSPPEDTEPIRQPFGVLYTAHHEELLAQAIVRIAEALGAEIDTPLTGPQTLLLADETADAARALADARQRLAAVEALADEMGSGFPYVRVSAIREALHD